jgi:hypothetical protein
VRLIELEKGLRIKHGDIISLADVYQKLCRNFSLKKKEIKFLLNIFDKTGLITLSKYGVALNFEVKNG